MKTLYRIHLITLFIYIGGIPGGIFLFLLINNLFNIQLPVWILYLIVLLCLILSASLRLLVWRKRADILTKEEMNHFGTKIFFSTAYLEVFTAIFAAIMFFQ